MRKYVRAEKKITQNMLIENHFEMKRMDLVAQDDERKMMDEYYKRQIIEAEHLENFVQKYMAENRPKECADCYRCCPLESFSFEPTCYIAGLKVEQEEDMISNSSNPAYKMVRIPKSDLAIIGLIDVIDSWELD